MFFGGFQGDPGLPSWKAIHGARGFATDGQGSGVGNRRRGLRTEQPAEFSDVESRKIGEKLIVI